MDFSTSRADPDRFLNFQTPGAQEWWYFDAISADGRDILVVVWYAGLPFDPKYGMAALRHLDYPSKYPIPNPLDHSAIGFQWYRDGKTVAYALNAFPARHFAHRAEPMKIDIAGNCLERDADGYHLRVSTPSVDGKSTVTADLRFQPAPNTEPFEKDFGTDGSTHLWILAAADCAVEGTISNGPMSSSFHGRGYHDHNAGEIEISRAIRRWEWGRVHQGERTDVFYVAEAHSGPSRSLWITCRDGQPEKIRQNLQVKGAGQARNLFGIQSKASLVMTDVDGMSGSNFVTLQEDGNLADRDLTRTLGPCLDDGPFYRRWSSNFLTGASEAQGISELLDTRNLNRRLFNWMIPYRLKRPHVSDRL